MSNFMENLQKESLGENYNEAYTRNGAKVFGTSGNPLVDFNFNITNYRSESEEKIIQDFKECLLYDENYALKYLFYLLDIREGLGERRSSKAILRFLGTHYPKLLEKVIELIPEYSRWDYILVLLDTPCKAKVISLIHDQLYKDLSDMKEGKPISLCAKWMKSINTSSAESKRIAKEVANGLQLTPKSYRKMLSKLRSYLKVTEKLMSFNKWGEINYNTVPSKANLIYKDAFLNHDKKRREEWLGKIEEKYMMMPDMAVQDEVKVNAKVCFPHEIIHQYTYNSYLWRQQLSSGTKPLLEGMWKELLTTIPDNFGKTLVVADGSGSMTSTIYKTNITNWEVAHGFAIAASEKCTGGFKDKYISFGASPKLVDLSTCKTLKSKIEMAAFYDDYLNTNIEKTFDLVLSTAISNNMEQKDMPDNILIVSDMQFDYACSDDLNANLFSTINKKFEDAGYKMPKLIFLNCNTGGEKTIPVIQNDLGVILISGYSAALLNMLLNGELDAWKALKATLDSDRYRNITI